MNKTEFVRAVSIRPFGEGETTAVARWAYEAPFEIYNGDPGASEDYLSVDDDGYGYYAVVDTPSEDVIGFCCFGQEARVMGQEPVEGTIDIGGGVRPDLLSEGIATEAFRSSWTSHASALPRSDFE